MFADELEPRFGASLCVPDRGRGGDRSGQKRFDDPLELRRAAVGTDRVRRGLQSPACRGQRSLEPGELIRDLLDGRSRTL